jgi:hypothetical protein
VIVQAKLVHDYSSDRDVLVKGLEAVGRRGTERGGQLMEAIMDVTKNLRAEGKRSILLVLRAGGEAASTMPSSDVKAQLRKTGATMYAVSFKGVDQSGTATAQTIIGQHAGALREEEQTTGANNLQQVLGDGTKESGGHYDEVVAAAASKTLEAIGNEILHQYEVVYAVPDGAKPSDKLAVSPKRKGVTLVRAEPAPDECSIEEPCTADESLRSWVVSPSAPWSPRCRVTGSSARRRVGVRRTVAGRRATGSRTRPRGVLPRARPTPWWPRASRSPRKSAWTF